MGRKTLSSPRMSLVVTKFGLNHDTVPIGKIFASQERVEMPEAGNLCQLSAHCGDVWQMDLLVCQL